MILDLRQLTASIPLRLSQNLQSIQKSLCDILCATCPSKREACLQDPVRIKTRSQLLRDPRVPRTTAPLSESASTDAGSRQRIPPARVRTPTATFYELHLI